MTVIGRMGNHLLTELICQDPFGFLFRGIALRDGHFRRHVLVRTFHEELRLAGISHKLAAAQAALAKLGPLKAYEWYQVQGGEESFAAGPYLAGRSLRAVLDKVKSGATPLPMDSGLALVWNLSQEVSKLRGQGFHHGLLNPCTVWVGFDGQLQILDAPLAGVFQAVRPSAPKLQEALLPYDPPGGMDESARDLWQLGAMAYELLMLEQLPLDHDPQQRVRKAAVERAAAGDDQGREPLPESLKTMLHRMLRTEGSFTSLQEFDRDLERALFDGEHVPTTFGLAFYMHDLFLKESNSEATAMKEEKGTDFFSHTEAATRLKSRIQDNLAVLSDAPLAAPRRGSHTGLLALVAALVVAGTGFLVFRARRESQITALKAEILASERKSAELSIHQNDQEQAIRDQALHQLQLEAQQAEAQNVQTRAELERQLELTRKRQAALDLQQKQMADAQRRLLEAHQGLDQRESSRSPGLRNEAPQPLVSRDLPPRLANPLKATLPPGFAGGAGAFVRVRVFINEQGRPQKALVMDGDPALVDLAKQAAISATYQPALHGGSPSRDWVTVSVSFER